MKLNDLFAPHNARSKAYKDHEAGDVPFVSNGLLNNGVVGFVKPLRGEKVFNFRGICLSSFCEATVHEPPILPRGNGGSGLIVLEPKVHMSFKELVYYAAYINRSTRWRFSFGRMVTKDRAKEIPLVKYDPSIECTDISSLLPTQHSVGQPTEIEHFAYVPITSLFHLHSGDYHKASSLPDGDIPLVSCGDTNNGIIRYCHVSEEHRYQGTITIAYNGQPLTTKFHPYVFAAKDDVAVCLPKRQLRLTTLIFLQYLLNGERWRFSYGRKCFREKLSRLKLWIPVKSDGSVDEDTIEEIVANTSYWDYFKEATSSIQQKKQPRVTINSFFS